jgi:hypothetical protein
MRFHSRLRSASITAVVALALLVGLRAAPSITQQPPTNATVNARAAQPTITSLSVTSGAVGTPVTITGSGFAAVQGSGTVTFNGITATIASWSSLSIVTAVPTNATTGPVIVSQNGLVSAGSAFTVTGSGVPLNCSDVTTRCVPSEYATIAAANTAAVAGDIVWVSAGTYAEHITLNASGTSGNTITFLANGTVNMCGFTWSAKNYVRIIGFTMDMSKPGCSGTVMSGSGTSTGLEFWNDTIENTGANKAYNIDIGLGGTNRCDKCIWFGGTITNINQSGTSGIVGTLIAGDDQFFGYVNISAVCYVGIGPVGARDRFDNNNFSALVQCGGTHPDNFYIATNATEGYTFSVVESTFGIGTPTGNNNKFMHAQNQNTPDWSDNIQRFNVGTNIGSGVYSQYSTGSGSNMRERFYNNTWVLDDRAVNGSQACGAGFASSGGTTLSLAFWNELYQQCVSDDTTSAIDTFAFSGGSGTMTKTQDYNLTFRQGTTYTFSSAWNAQPHRQSNVDPKLNNVAGNDFTLQSSSGARGTGGPLTTATSCSGTTLNVASGTGSFFVPDDSANLPAYGGLLMPGDTITVGTSTTRKVLALSGDALTVDSALTCAASDPVYFGSSNVVDIGAYPYKAGGYTLSATLAQVGSTVTITPNDASLARFAVVFENGMPKCIASAANAWACTVGSGVITATIHPRYASQTQSVVVQ